MDFDFSYKPENSGLADEKPEVRYVTKTGQVADIPGARSVYDIMRDELARLDAERKPPTVESVRAVAGIRPLASLSATPVVLDEKKSTDGSAMRLVLSRDDDLTPIPLAVFLPAKAKGDPVMLVSGQPATGLTKEIQEFISQGRAVAVVQLRGFGATAKGRHSFCGSKRADEEMAVMAISVGQNLAALRAEDAALAARHFASMAGAGRVALVAHATAAIPAAHAYFLERGLFSSFEKREAPPSWREVVANPTAPFSFADTVFGALKSYDWTDLVAPPKQTLEHGFKAPPRSARPQTWYHLMNGNVSKEGVTRDFEEIARAGLGGVQMFDIGSDAPPGPMTFGTPEWFDFMKHAHREAVRLGLEVAVRDGTGWSNSGGKWITPEHSMKNTTYSETNVAGPQKRWRAKLPRTERDCGFYRDVAVLAYPTPKGNVELKDWPLKTGRARTRFSCLEHDKRTFSAAEIVAKERVIDLTDRMKPDGTVEWDVPEGNWTILRLGYAGTGRFSHPTSHDAGGLEVDKLSAKALDIHFDSYVGRLMRHIGVTDASDRSCGVNGVLVDSYEVSGQNWTQDLDKIFEARMGYSIRPWLPVFAKRIVGSTEATERFLDDFRRVLADLFADNYIGRLAERCHEFGLKLWFEPYGNGVFDDLQTGRRSDVPMGEFWNRVCLGEHGIGGPGNVRLVAYVSYIWGRRLVAAEAFTSSPPAGGRWMATPFAIKSQGDRAYAEGMNLVVYHRYTHQPWPDDKYLPGMTMGRHGMHLDRAQTWWKHVPAWLMYQSRCQWMLQEGTFVADALYWAGEQTPNTGFGDAGIQHPEDDMRAKYRAKNGRTNGTLSNGWNWDVCDTEALAELKVRDGKIVVPSGVEYAILVLPAAERQRVRGV